LAPFQSLYERSPRLLSVLPLTPQWFSGTLVLATLTTLGILWSPFLLALPLLAATTGASTFQAVKAAARPHLEPPSRRRIRMRALIALLHVLQPLARLLGYARAGPRRLTKDTGLNDRAPRKVSFWSEQWQPADAWLQGIEDALRRLGVAVVRGGAVHRWDLEVRGGAIGAARLLMAVEEHGRGRQLLRFAIGRRWASWGLIVAVLALGLAVAAALDRAFGPAVLLAGLSVLISVKAAREGAAASATMAHTVRERLREVATPLDASGRQNQR
jgi:hypothetical protein